MTEKRFHFGYVLGDTGLIDEQAEHKWFVENCCNITDLKKNWKTVCDKLNELAEENEQLKQFQEDVFNKIDMHLRMLPTAVDNEFNEEDGDPSLYVGAIYMLETLKKELEE